MAVPAESSPNFCTMCLISKNRSCIVKVITSTRHGAKPPTVIGAPPQKLPTHVSCVNQLLPNSSSNYRQMVLTAVLLVSHFRKPPSNAFGRTRQTFLSQRMIKNSALLTGGMRRVQVIPIKQ